MKGGVEVDGRQLLHEANREKWPPDQLFQIMARYVPKLYAPYLLKNGKKKPLIAPGPSPKSKRMILFTDPKLSNMLRVDQPVSLMERDVVKLLRKAFRLDYDGWIINPGDSSRRIINRSELPLLFCEYIVEEGRRLGGGWVPTRGKNMLLVELEDGNYTVAVYIDEREAREVCNTCGGEPVLHSWDEIGDRCLRAGGKAPYIQFGYPEQVLLLPRHMDQLRGRESVERVENVDNEENVENVETPELRESLRQLEQAVMKGQGWVNTREIARRMAELDKIWTLVDPDGKPVISGSEGEALVVDFFTSQDHALRLIQAFQQRGEEIAGIKPRLVDARSLFEHLSVREPIVWINRGSSEGWTSISNHLLPAVLKGDVLDSGESSRVKI